MTDMPERIWAWYFMPDKQTPEMQGGWTDTEDRREVEYPRRDVARAEAQAALERGIRLGLRAAAIHACECIDHHSEHDALLCCDGRMCGCQGASIHDHMKHFIRALADDPTAVARIAQEGGE